MKSAENSFNGYNETKVSDGVKIKLSPIDEIRSLARQLYDLDINGTSNKIAQKIFNLTKQISDENKLH